MITESQPTPVFGRDGEPCPGCGAPLAGDQRYCLHCGARRPEARLEFLDVLDADVHARSALSPTPFPVAARPAGGGGWGPPLVSGGAEPPRGFNARLQANAGLLALASLLLLTLLIGLLLGHWATGSSSPTAVATPAPQVIKVEGGATGTAAPTQTTGGADTGAASSKKSASSAKSATSATSSTKATAPKDAVSVKSLNSKKAVEDAVKKGKPISTGTGKLPPKDGKAPGGGSGFEEIG